MKTDGTNNKAVETKKPKTIYTMLEGLKPQLAKALPAHVTPERLTRVALTAVRNNPKLGQADSTSLLGSIMTAAQLGLEPNTPLGQCYIIPYKDRATFQIGYKGLLDLALRTKQYKRITARSVDASDDFSFEYGLEESLKHIPAKVPSGNSVYFYAVYELDNGGKSFAVWSREQIEAHAKKYSKAYDQSSSPWKSAFDQMAKKTVLIDLLRYAPKSVELAQAASFDNQTFNVNPADPDLSIDTVDGDFEEAV